MSTHVVVEGLFDAVFLKKLLSDVEKPYTILPAGGRDAARPIARRVLIQLREPTALVFDTDTTDPNSVKEQLLALESYFSRSPSDVDFKLIAMVPTMEIIFFDRPNTLHKRLGNRWQPVLEEAARVAPKPILQQLIRYLKCPDTFQLIESLSTEEVQDLAKHENIVELKRFIRRPSRAQKDAVR